MMLGDMMTHCQGVRVAEVQMKGSKVERVREVQLLTSYIHLVDLLYNSCDDIHTSSITLDLGLVQGS